MPRPRLSDEMPQKQSPRGPPQVKPTGSPSGSRHSPRTERSPKTEEGRPSHISQSDPVNKKKLGTRIADLESQLGQAQDELKCLKDQFVSTDVAKRIAQDQLEKRWKKPQNIPEPLKIQEKQFDSVQTEELDMKNNNRSSEVLETDVFEVPIETKYNLSVEMAATSEPDGLSTDEQNSEYDDMNLLKSKLDEKDKELEAFRMETTNLRNELSGKSLELASARSEMEELILRVKKADQEVEKSKNTVLQINGKLDVAEKAKEELESEMRKLRVQTEQWRKAADAAASVLEGGMEMNGRGGMSERCGSMEKHYGSVFDRGGGYVGSPGVMDDSDDVLEGGKRKGSAIKMFGDMWKKKGQK